MKKEWLASTALSTLGNDIFLEAARISHARRHSAKIALQPCRNVLMIGDGPGPKAAPLTEKPLLVKKEEEGALPASLEMVGYFLVEIAAQNYDIRPMDIVYVPASFKDGSIGIALAPLHNGVISETPDEEPDVYDALYDMIRDLCMINTNPNIRFLNEELYFEAPSKTALCNLLQDYLRDPEFKLHTPENVRFSPRLDKNKILAKQQLKECFYLWAAEGARFDETQRKDLFQAVMPRSYLSREHYNVGLLAAFTVEVFLPISHLRRVIEQEDKLPPANYREHALDHIGLN